MEHLRVNQIVLEVCPTSNVRTRSVAAMAEHPLPRLVAAGVPVTINSDDPPMFSTTLNSEYAIAAELLALDELGVAELSRAAVQASFMDVGGKATLLAEIDDYVLGSAVAASP
jgi:adenosine deaminase/aminodeoxyfutalosine deaminase